MPSPRSRPASRRWLLVRLGGHPYALDTRHVRHLLPCGAGAAPAVRFDGAEYRVLDLVRLFRLDPGPASATYVLVHDDAGARAALPVDGVVGLIDLGEGEVTALPAVYRGRERRWFAGLARTESALAIVLSVPGVLEAARAAADPAAPVPAGGER